MSGGVACSTIRDCSLAQACEDGVCTPPYEFFGYSLDSRKPTWHMLAIVLYHVVFCMALTVLLTRVIISIIREKRQTGKFDLDVPSNSCRTCLAINCILYYFYTIFFLVIPVASLKAQSGLFVLTILIGVTGELFAIMAVGIIGLSFLSVGVRTGLTSPWGYRCTQYVFAAMSLVLFTGTLATFLARLFVVGLIINSCYFILAFCLHEYAGFKMTNWLWTSLEHRMKEGQQEPSLALQYYHNIRWCVRRIMATGLVGLVGKLVNIADPSLTFHITIVTSSFQRVATSFILLEFTEMMRARVGVAVQAAKLNVPNPATVAPEQQPTDHLDDPNGHVPRPWFGILGRMSTIAERSEIASMSLASGFRRGFASGRSSMNPSMMWKMGVAVIEEQEDRPSSVGPASSSNSRRSSDLVRSVLHENEDGIIIPHMPTRPQPQHSHALPDESYNNRPSFTGAREGGKGPKTASHSNNNSARADDHSWASREDEESARVSWDYGMRLGVFDTARIDDGVRNSSAHTQDIEDDLALAEVERGSSPYTHLGTLLEGIGGTDDTTAAV